MAPMIAAIGAGLNAVTAADARACVPHTGYGALADFALNCANPRHNASHFPAVRH